MDLSSPKARLAFFVSLAVVILAVNVQYSLKIIQSVERSGERDFTRSALLRWMPQIEDLWQGEDIYARHNYPNPPIMAFVLTPFTVMPPWLAALSWFYIKVGLAALAILWTFRLVEGTGPPFPVWAKIATVVLSLRPIIGDLSHGNVNILILFLVVATLYAFRHRRDGLAGVILALAIAFKVTPALFLPYFAYKRAWGVLVGCAIGLGLFFVVIPGAVLGQARNLELLGGWYRVMVKPFVIDGQVTPEHQNQSLPGLACRLLSQSAAFSTYIEDEVTGVDVYTPVSYMTVVDLGPAAARWLVKGVMILFGLLVLWSCRAPAHSPTWERTDPRGSWRLAAEYSLILVGMLIFSERTWKHHAVILLVPFAVLCYALAVLPLNRWLRGGVLATLASVLLLTWATSESFLGKTGADYTMGYGCYTASFVILAGGLVALLKAGPNPSAEIYQLSQGRVWRQAG